MIEVKWELWKALAREGLMAKCIGIEACGFITLFNDGCNPARYSPQTWFRPATNVSTNPERSFVIDPYVHRQLLGLSHIEIVGTYHSHPNHDAVPSEADMAAWEANPHSMLHFIIGLRAQPMLAVFHRCGTTTHSWRRMEMSVTL